MATAEQTILQIEQGRWDACFTALYGDEAGTAMRQRIRYKEAIAQFARLHGEHRPVRLYSAPGRTEIGGNHTDHNNGKVLAAAVNLDIVAVVSPRGDDVIQVQSQGFRRPDSLKATLLMPQKREEGRSSAMIRGVADAMVKRGGKVGGIDVFTTSDVLRGSGLSSSAAFEVCIACILNEEYNGGSFTPIELAMMGQYAENVHFGKPSGLMDQMASAVGRAVTIDFRDPAQPVVRQLPLDLASFGYHMVITDTKGSHAQLTDEYAAIRLEMEAVAAFFGKKVLAEVGEMEFLSGISALRPAVGDRAVLRAFHFYEECKRVDKMAASIQDRNFDAFLSLILLGGHSSFEYNQNAYSLQNPAHQGVPLGLALSQKVLQGTGAWRLQGGGFAGTIQAFVPQELLDEYRATLQAVFGEGACYTLSVRKYGCTEVTQTLGE